MLLRTEGIVLSSAPQGETSRRAVIYSQDKGRLSVLAKGARLVRSPFGSSLQTLSHVQAVIYYRTPHSLHLLRECSHIHSFQRTLQDLDKLVVGMRICELTRHLTESEDPDSALYDLLLLVLKAINDTSGKEEHILLYYQLRLASLLGFAPAFTKRDLQDLPDDSGGFLHYEDGAVILARPTAGPSVWANRNVLRAFAVLARADLDVALDWTISSSDLREVRRLVENYLKYHVADAYPARGGTIMQTLYSAPDLCRKAAPFSDDGPSDQK